MNIYPIGYFLIPLGLYYFLFKPKKLYELTVFSIPFTGTSVFKITVGSFDMEGIRASMFLGTLCLVQHLLVILNEGHLRVNKSVLLPSFFLSLFAFAGIFSLIMPIIIDGKIDVLDTYSNLMMYAKPKPLYFKFQYVTQTMYLVFGVALAYFFAIKNSSIEKIYRSIEIYLYASLFVCIWGLVELVLFHLNLTYPAFLFNNNSMSYAGTIVLDGKPRITSVALEPSILSQQLLTALPFVFWPLIAGDTYRIRPNPKILFILIVIVLFFTTSTTAIFGLGVFFLFVVIRYFKKKKINIYVLGFIFISTIALFIFIPFLIEEIVTKLSTFSGTERLKAIHFGFLYFKQYPLLGIGWGVFPTWDIVVCILAGTGILGFSFFLIHLILLYINFDKRKSKETHKLLSVSIKYSLLVLLLISQFSGFIYHSQYFWFILGIAIAFSAINDNIKLEKHQVH